MRKKEQSDNCMRETIHILGRVIEGAIIDGQIYNSLENMWRIRVKGKSVVITDTEEFVRLIQLADKAEVYTQRDGTVEILFTYTNLKDKE